MSLDPAADILNYNDNNNNYAPSLFPPAMQELPQAPPLVFNIRHYNTTAVTSRPRATPSLTERNYTSLLCNLKYVKDSSTGLKSSDTSQLNSDKSVVKSSSNSVSRNGPFRGTGYDEEYLPYVIGITPTYTRLTQKLDLTRLCQTLMNVPRFLWIVVEDGGTTSELVKEVLSNCQVRFFSK